MNISHFYRVDSPRHLPLLVNAPSEFAQVILDARVLARTESSEIRRHLRNRSLLAIDPGLSSLIKPDEKAPLLPRDATYLRKLDYDLGSPPSVPWSITDLHQKIQDQRTLIRRSLRFQSDAAGVGTTPSVLIPPYVHYSVREQTGRHLNNSMALKAKDGQIGTGIGSVWPVIVINQSFLNKRSGVLYEDIERLQKSGISEVFVWFDGKSEYHLLSQRLFAMAAIIKFMSDRGVRVSSLYGTYFTILLGHIGLFGVASGPGVSEHRSGGRVGNQKRTGGPAPARYYLPSAHHHVRFEDAEIFALTDPIYRCDCGVIDRYNAYRQQAIHRDELVKAAAEHYLHVRANEIKFVRTTSLEECLNQLGEAGNSIASIDNETAMEIATSLVRWRTALESFVSSHSKAVEPQGVV